MKHKLNSFSGAFEGTTKGLEGIANALKREEPIPPPYIPTGFPAYIKIDTVPSNFSSLVKLISVTEWPQYQTISGYNPQLSFNYDANIGIYTLDDIYTITFNNQFNIIDCIPRGGLITSVTVEWVDPSILPQS